jgi:hypothetical protein
MPETKPYQYMCVCAHRRPSQDRLAGYSIGGTYLCPTVIALSHALRWVVRLPEPAEDVCEGQLARVKQHLHCLQDTPCQARPYVHSSICWLGVCPGRVCVCARSGNLGVSGLSAANFLVGRVGGETSSVATRRGPHTWQPPRPLFRAPEASVCKHRLPVLLRVRAFHLVEQHIMLGTDSHLCNASGQGRCARHHRV